MKKKLLHRFGWLAFVLLSPCLLAQSLDQYLKDDNLLLMAVEFYDGARVTDALPVYHVGQKWYLPLGELTEGMDVALKVSTALMQAEGFIADERRTLHMDFRKCEYRKMGKLAQYECPLIVIQNDEAFIESNLFERIFDIRLTFDIHQSLIITNTEFKYPIQKKLERERNAKSAHAAVFNGVPPDFQRQSFRSRMFSGPSIDQQLGVSAEEDQTKFNHNTFYASQLFGLDTKIFIGGEDSNITEWSANLARKSPEGHLLGRLHAKEIQAFDFSTPTVSLISQGGRVRGALVSNFELNATNNFTTREFRGPLASGWDVELYQNDTLVGRFAAEEATEYVFRDVPLFYGINRFALVFYGPQGQRYEENEVINVDGSRVLPGETRYRLVQGRRPRTDHDISIVQLSQGVSSRFGLDLAYFRGPPKDGQASLDYGLLGASLGLGRVLLGAQFAANNEGSGGSGLETSLQVPFRAINFGLSHTSLNRFRSEQYNREVTGSPTVKVNKVRLNTSLPFLLGAQISVEANQLTNEDRSSQWTGLQRTAFQTMDLHWFNTLAYDDSSDIKLGGELASLYSSTSFEIRTAVKYRRVAESGDLSVMRRFQNTHTANVSLQSAFRTGELDYGLGWTKALKHVTLSSNFNANLVGHWQITGLLSYGSLFDKKEKEIVVKALPMTDTGAVSASVFTDLNHNRVRDPGERGMPGIKLQVNNQEIEVETDDQGKVTLTHLPTYQVIGLSLSMKTLADPMYRPLERGISAVLRPATVETIEFPVGIFSEITGIVQLASTRKNRGVRGLKMRLLNSSGEVRQTTRVESDGFYAFEGVPPGQYLVDFDPTTLMERELRAAPQNVAISIPETGLDQGSYDFVLQ